MVIKLLMSQMSLYKFIIDFIKIGSILKELSSVTHTHTHKHKHTHILYSIITFTYKFERMWFLGSGGLKTKRYIWSTFYHTTCSDSFFPKMEFAKN